MAVVSSLQAGTVVEIAKNTLAQPYLGVVPLCTGSGNQPNANAVATLTGTPTTLVNLSGFVVTGAGANTDKVVLVTVAGLLGGTRSFAYGFLNESLAVNQPLALNFSPPLQAAAVNTPIVITLPAGGTGNLYAMVTAYGYYSTVPEPSLI